MTTSTASLLDRPLVADRTARELLLVVGALVVTARELSHGGFGTYGNLVVYLARSRDAATHIGRLQAGRLSSSPHTHSRSLCQTDLVDAWRAHFVTKLSTRRRGRFTS